MNSNLKVKKWKKYVQTVLWRSFTINGARGREECRISQSLGGDRE